VEVVGHLAGAQALGQELDVPALAGRPEGEPGPEIDADCGLVGGPEALVGGEPVLPGRGGFAREVVEGEDAKAGGASDLGVREVGGASSAGAVGGEGAAVLDPPAGEVDDGGEAEEEWVLAAWPEAVPGDPGGGPGVVEGLFATVDGPSVAAEVVGDGVVDPQECGVGVALGLGRDGRWRGCGVGHGGDLSMGADRRCRVRSG
jgi:hypothetical protein